MPPLADGATWQRTKRTDIGGAPLVFFHPGSPTFEEVDDGYKRELGGGVGNHSLVDLSPVKEVPQAHRHLQIPRGHFGVKLSA